MNLNENEFQFKLVYVCYGKNAQQNYNFTVNPHIFKWIM